MFDAAALLEMKKVPGRPLDLRDEQMHADLDAQVSRLLRSLELDPALAGKPSEQPNTMPGFKQENRLSFLRRGAVGEWQNTLTESPCKIRKEEAGEEMILAGYEGNLEW